MTNKKLIPLAAAVFLLAGCPLQKGDDETKKELAALKGQLAQQQKQEAERAEKAKLEEQEVRQQQREDEIYRQAQADMELRQAFEAEEKKQAQEEQAKQEAEKSKQEALKKKPVGKLARYQAVVISESGYGALNLRGSPSAQSVVVTELQDGTEVQVIAETDVCHKSRSHYGCWVKVKTREGLTGYLMNAYLQRTNAAGFSRRQEEADTAGDYRE